VERAADLCVLDFVVLLVEALPVLVFERLLDVGDLVLGQKRARARPPQDLQGEQG
jgi:hypothetical protein